MFTVKHLDTCGLAPNEEIFAAKSVKYRRRSDIVMSQVDPADPLGLRVSLVEGGEMQFYAGIVYVMNGEGKTVAKYDLGECSGSASARV